MAWPKRRSAPNNLTSSCPDLRVKIHYRISSPEGEFTGFSPYLPAFCPRKPLSERNDRWNKGEKIMSLLKRGLKGAPVKRLQDALGITADGDFGPGTERALRAYQEKAGLAVDGIAGPDTFTSLGLHELVLLRKGSRGQAVKDLQAGLGIEADGIFGTGTEAAVIAFQTANGLDGDGLAGPETLARMDSFTAMTQEVIKKAEVQPDEEHFESEPLPEIKGTQIVKGGLIPVPEKKSVWGKVKGWFS